ncbi:M23 family metallopeptidase [Buchananella hordeovulneris]|uniref:M23 family metallopeptidase n=1 Tax=Buchananella hordeovulneris TaxID=52770 RepID=UPI000F5EC653|nr:M23 family metallopeptidase [Buchananella hordeovulneris]RRD42340.1 hypothetical protein EII13_09690 [Buchananella hordeovulneris]RRD50146.1 hypothetical protein EII12_09720 [Buchananella hordeovulneris]
MNPKTASPRTRRLLAAFVVLLLALGGVLFTHFPALADEKDDLENQQTQAEGQREKLRASLNGIDKSIADTYVQLEGLRAQLPGLREEHAAAVEKAAAAERTHTQITDRLAVAEQQRDDLDAAIEVSEEKIETERSVLADLARRAYRGELSTTSLEIALTSSSPQDFAQRAAAADVATRTRTRSIESLENETALNKNRASRRELVVGQISDLQAEAEVALAEARTAEEAAGQALTKVEQAEATAASLSDQLTKDRNSVEKQLADLEKSYNDRAERIKKIDAENRARQQAAAEAERAAQPAAPAAPAAPPANGGSGGGGMFRFPVDGNPEVTSPYGWRIHPILGVPKFHEGVDLGVACGQPQYAIADGEVTEAYFDAGGGNLVYINHGLIDGNSYMSGYLHLEYSTVGVGQYVRRGDVIGYTGTTGRSSGCHVHFEIWQNGATTDPMSWY